MEKEKHPILHVEDAEVILETAKNGMVPLHSHGPFDINETFQAVADGDLERLTQLEEDGQINASQPVVLSYIHASSKDWYGRVARGKFHLETKERLVSWLSELRPSACWLDQWLAQKRGDGDAGWALVGLVPYALFPVLVIGNMAPLKDICDAYVFLERLPREFLDIVPTRVISLLHRAQDKVLESSVESESFIHFVDMCRFWPMMERAMAHKAQGFTIEEHTHKGLCQWKTMLTCALRANVAECGQVAPRTDHASVVLTDMLDMVEMIQMSRDGSPHCPGLGLTALTALTAATSALASGALMNAPLFDFNDRDTLLIAGVCFSLLARESSDVDLESSPPVDGSSVKQILEHPQMALKRLLRTHKFDVQVTSSILAKANTLYNRAAVENTAASMHAGVNTEATVFSLAAAEVPVSRKWLGQCDLLPRLGLCLREQLVDLARTVHQTEGTWDTCFSDRDVTGKGVVVALSAGNLTPDVAASAESSGPIPLVAFSAYNTVWSLRSVEREAIEKNGLGGWTSRPMLLGMCYPSRRLFLIEAVVITHLSLLEDDLFANGGIRHEKARNFVRGLLKRSSVPIHQTHWILTWMDTHFSLGSEAEPFWYSGTKNHVPIPLHQFTWIKWNELNKSIPHELDPQTNRMSVVRLSCVGFATLSTKPQLPLLDLIRFCQASMALSGTSGEKRTAYATLNRTLQTWLGLVTGLYRAYDQHYRDAKTNASIWFLPAYTLSEAGFSLAESQHFMGETSGFIDGLKRTGAPVSEKLPADEQFHCLSFDGGSRDDFWRAKAAILSTCHAHGFMLWTAMVAVLIEASSSVTNSTSQKEGEDQKDAISRLVSELSQWPPIRAMMYRLVHGMLRRAAFGETSCDWRVPGELRHDAIALLQTLKSPLVQQLENTIGFLNELHWMKEHVKASQSAGATGSHDPSAANSKAFDTMLLRPEQTEASAEVENIRDASEGDKMLSFPGEELFMATDTGSLVVTFSPL